MLNKQIKFLITKGSRSTPSDDFKIRIASAAINWLEHVYWAANVLMLVASRREAAIPSLGRQFVVFVSAEK